MKLLQIEAPGRPVWRDAPIPEPGPGEVLVRIAGVTTCPQWDLHIMAGRPMIPGRPVTYPYPPGEPGHEAVGEVAAVGDGVLGFEVGDRVAAWRDSGGRRQGCYAQYAALEAEHLIVVPASLPLESVASLELAMCVQGSFDPLLALGAVEGRRVAVGGLGPAGLIAVQLARAYGAGEIVGIDPLPDRRALALTLGAHRVAAPDDEGLPTDRFSERSYHAAVDTTGLKVSIEALMRGTLGAVAIFGVLREDVVFGPAQWWGGAALLGYGTHERRQAEQALQLIQAGRLDLSPLVTHRLPFSEYEHGVDLLRRKEAVKVLFLPWDPA